MTFPVVPVQAKAAGVLALCLLSFVVGHGTRKTIEVEKIRQVESTAATKVAEARTEAVTAKKEAAAAKTQWRTRTVYLPGGTVEVTKEVVREVERHHEEQAAQVVTHTVVETKTVYQDRAVTKTVAAPLPTWSVTASGGLGLDGKPRYGGELGRRLFGGVWITAGADVSTRAATLGVRLEF